MTQAPRALRRFATEARRELSQSRSTRFFAVLLCLMAVGLVIGAALGWEFGALGLLFLVGGMPGALVVAVCYYATPRIRKTAAVGAVALIPIWVVAGILGAVTGTPEPDLLMASGVGGVSYVGSVVQGLVMVTAVQGGVVLLKGLQDR